MKLKKEKNYLTTEEIASILYEMNKLDTPFEREIEKVAMAVQFCFANVDNDTKDCNQIYDYCMSQADMNIYYEIKNLNTIDVLYEKEHNTYILLKQFISEFYEKFGADLEKFSKQLDDVNNLKGELTNLGELSTKN